MPGPSCLGVFWYNIAMHETRKTAKEVSTVLDSLAALTHDLACHKGTPRDQLVLTAGKTQDACDAIESAVIALRQILEIAEAAGGGPIPDQVADKLDDAQPS